MNFSHYCGRLVSALLVIAWSVLPSVSSAVEVNKYPVLVKLVAQMIAEDGYPKDELNRVLQQANIKQKTIDLINKPSEALPWYQYRNRFINKERTAQGVKFWNKNEATLNRAYEKFGILQSVIVALIGVETHYGTHMGNDRVLDSLVTLAAKYPQRSLFFTAELRAFLNITRKGKIDPTSVLGSYAGAIGMPQFMPSSYVMYSVDFNGNDQKDLVNEVEDAIGSVANYLHVHGWKKNQRIYAEVSEALSKSAAKWVTNKAKLVHTPEQLSAAGVKFDASHSSNKMMLVALQEVRGSRHIVGFRNFYAITRYNHSINYAMAVTALAESITLARNAQ